MIFPLGICAVRSSNANHPSTQRQTTNLKQGAEQGASRMRRPLLANSHWHWGTMLIRYRKTTYGVQIRRFCQQIRRFCQQIRRFCQFSQALQFAVGAGWVLGWPGSGRSGTRMKTQGRFLQAEHTTYYVVI